MRTGSYRNPQNPTHVWKWSLIYYRNWRSDHCPGWELLGMRHMDLYCCRSLVQKASYCRRVKTILPLLWSPTSAVLLSWPQSCLSGTIYAFLYSSGASSTFKGLKIQVQWPKQPFGRLFLKLESALAFVKPFPVIFITQGISSPYDISWCSFTYFCSTEISVDYYHIFFITTHNHIVSVFS